MSDETLHILCYRWGTRYGVDYVNRLQSMVSRNLRRPHAFHCLTDDPLGLNPSIIAHPLPDDHFKGNWNKLMTFQADFLGLHGKLVVCLDVDIVITDSIDFLGDNPQHDFMIARNWAKGVRGNSSVYRVRIGKLTQVWTDFMRDTERNIETFHGKNRQFGDQQWMNHAIPDYHFFPEGKIVSFKRHCGAKSWQLKLPFAGEISGARFGHATVPPGAAIILFHGDPLPPDVARGTHGRWKQAPFVAEHWR